jgi:hypothetical protein
MLAEPRITKGALAHPNKTMGAISSKESPSFRFQGRVPNQLRRLPEIPLAFSVPCAPETSLILAVVIPIGYDRCAIRLLNETS